MTEEKKYFTYIDTVTGNKDMKKGHCLDKTAILLCDTNKCSNYKYCYYKQLIRLEKEVKHWQMEYSEAKAKGEWTYDLVRKKVDRLKQENEEPKNEINKLGKKHEDYCNTMYWQMKEQIDKYRSALEEIRNLCNKGAGVYTNAKIVGLINEVLGNESN